VNDPELYTHKMTEQLKNLLILAIPIMATQFSQMAMGFIDTIMAGHASAADLAAVAVGSSIWIPFFLFMAGILTAITATIAQYRGAQQFKPIGHTIRQSIWLGLMLSLLGYMLLTSTHSILITMDVAATLIPITSGYLHAIAWGMPAIAGFLILRYLNEGMGNIVPVMITGVLGLGINIISNYILIFGHFGAPALGGIGAGWATTITHWCMLLVLLIYVYKSKKHQHLKLFSGDIFPHLAELSKLIKLGLPIGIALFVEGSIFSVIALLIASLGVLTVASHQIALNFSSLIFISPLSISMALTIQVGHAVGAKQFQQAQDTIKAGYVVNLTTAIIAALLILNFATEIAQLYSNDQQVVQLASGLMLFAALYQVSDGIQLSAAGSLRGLKDTAVPMLFSIIAYWFIGLPLGYILGLTDLITPPMAAKGFWIGLIFGLTISAILLSLRLYAITRSIRPE
jgi:MATE family multidrug resistance protein